MYIYTQKENKYMSSLHYDCITAEINQVCNILTQFTHNPALHHSRVTCRKQNTSHGEDLDTPQIM